MSLFPPIIVVSGASGSGKTTLCRLVAQRLNFYYSVSYTTRSKRPKEADGVDYYFITQEQFDKMIRKGEFLEWASVYGNYYGTSKKIIDEHLKKGKGVILDLDTKGALSIKKQYPLALLIFIRVPSMQDLRQRLSQRGSESQDVVDSRLKEVQKEESLVNQYDHILVNRDVEETFLELKKIIKKN